jgi:hypothetical protein
MKERSLSRGCRRLLWRFVVPDNGRVSTDKRAELGPRENREPRRAVKAGRRPPGGEALTARSVVLHIIDAKTGRASWSSPCDAVSGTRCGPSPEPTKVGGGHPRTRGPVIYSSREATWSGSAATWWAQSLTRSRRRTGTMTVSELAPGCVRPGSHPVSARQRISPSRRP